MDKKASVQLLQFQQILPTSSTSIITSVILAGVLAFMQRDVIPPTTILIWFSLLVAVSIARFALVRTFRRTPSEERSVVHSRLKKFRLGVLTAGTVWGIGGFLLFPAHDSLHQVFVIMMLAGLTAGGVVSYSAYFFSASGYAFTALLPILVRLFATGDTLSVAVAMTGTLFLCFMIISLRHINRHAHHNILLRLEAADREETMQASEERYRLLLSNSPVGIFHYDTNLVITYCNGRLAEILSAPIERIIGLDMKRVQDRSVLPALQQALAGEQSCYEGHYQATFSPASGWIIMTCAPSRDSLGNISGGIAIIQDSTVRKQAENALQQQLLFSDALNKISKSVIEHTDQSSILTDAASIIGKALQTDRALIYDVSFEKQQAICLCQWLNPQHPDTTPTQATYPLNLFMGAAIQIRESRSFLTSHSDRINPCLLEDGSAKILHQDLMIKSLIWHPMAFYQDGYYLLTLSQVYSGREWSKEEKDFLDSVSKMVHIALEKIRLLDEYKQTEIDLRIAAIAFESQEGMLITDANNTILRVNQSFTNITGYSAADALGQSTRILGSGRHDANFFAVMWGKLNHAGAWEGEIWNRRKNGEIYPAHLIITAVKDSNNTISNYVATFSDITNNKLAEEEIRNLAFYDPLTHLPNRRLLTDRLTQAFSSSARSGREGALLFIDLDNFKLLNDTMGHVIGDMLLQQVANRLTTCVREGDTVARLGGDEFVVLLEELDEYPIEAASQTEAVGGKILTVLNQPYQLDGREHRNTPSIGATLFKGHQNGVDDLFKQADIAMYQAKRAGRNTLCFFDPKMQETINTRAELEGELSKALDNRQFHLYYQIQIDHANQPMGAETLIRWIHPERGLVSPGQFIPLAEDTGLILPIGEWVLETACAQIKTWQQKPQTSGLVLAVNVSAQQFRLPNFVAQVEDAVQRHAINPKLLKLELTESMLLENITDIIATMSKLREIGVGFSLDDFGTGYSSLQYLKRLPLNQLKIDQSFVRDLAIDKSDKAIVRTIIAMAHSLDLNVIAEGVETEEQRQYLLDMNCTHFQGYLFGKPIPIGEFDELLKNL